MDLGWSVELSTPWTWAGLWNWALHGPGLVCGIAHSGLVCGIGHSMDLGCLHPGPSGIRGSMGLGFVQGPGGCRFPPTLSHSVALSAFSHHYGTQGGRASIQMVVLMTESEPTPHYSRGTGYHAFRGPRPVAWGQRSFSDAHWECRNLNFHILIIFTKKISWASIIILPSPAIFHMHCTNLQQSQLWHLWWVVGAAELRDPWGGGGGGDKKTHYPNYSTLHTLHLVRKLSSYYVMAR